MTIDLALPSDIATDAVIQEALREDLASAGDVTTNAIVPASLLATAELVARQDGTLAGLDIARRVFARLDSGIAFDALAKDGDDVERGQPLARLHGHARAVLTGERTALNFVGRLSGIATLTRAHVDAVSGTDATVVATRKTTPGLRALEKYAVVAGGGGPHRHGLYDAVLIKDNHVALAGGIGPAVERVRQHVGRLVPVQVEVDTLEQLEELLPLRVDSVLCDNFAVETLRAAVAMARGELITEASGGITLDSIGAVAETGVERISVGALTHSAPVLDIALDVAMGSQPAI